MNVQVALPRLVNAANRPTGTAALAGLAVATAATFGAAWISPPAFLAGFGVLLLLVVYTAARWPRASLVGAVLATLADPYVIRGLLPADARFAIVGVSEALIAAVGVAILLRGLRSGTIVAALRDPVTVLGAAFIGVALLSAAVNGVSAGVAALGLIATLDALVVYFLVRLLPFDRSAVGYAVAALVGTVLLAALLGLAQALLTPQVLWFQAHAGRFGEGGRITGFMGNPNLLAAVLGLAIPFPLYAVRHLETRRDRGIALTVLFLLTLALVLTFSRGAWAAVLIGVVIGTLIIEWRLLAIMGIVVVAAYLTSTIMPRNLLVDPDDLPPYAQGDAPPDIFDSLGNRLGTLGTNRDLRLRFIVEGVPILLDHPLLGAGPGRYGGAVAKITDSGIYDEYGTSLYGYRTVHNFWLHTMGEVGALGTAIWLTLVIGLIVRFVRAARATLGTDRLLLGAAATSTIVVVLHNGTEMLFEGNTPAFAIWLVLGLGSLLAARVPTSATAEAPAGP